MKKVKVGVIGCGNISGIYFKNCPKMGNLEVAACADLDMRRAEAKAKEFGIPKACSVDGLLADGEIRIVLNLTIPKAHTEINLRALDAGKHVYVEKPLALSRRDGEKVIKKAKKKKLLVGCAPDTFMGAGIQACRKLLDSGALGEPIAASAFMMCHGHESWHPDPEFYYKKGGGPMFDMGPYYLTALVNLVGPVLAVSGMTGISFPERVITSREKHGTRIKVEVPTHVAGLLDFKNGAIGTIITSFDVWAHQMPHIELYCAKGTLRVPDPNSFGGNPLVRYQGEGDWSEVPLSNGFSENSRSVGVSDMARALEAGGSFRPEGALAFHVLDIMQSIHESALRGRKISLKSSCARPEPMPGVSPGNEENWTQ